MGDSLPNAKSAHSLDRREKLQRLIAERSLGGLANDTKWDELIDAMRADRTYVNVHSTTWPGGEIRSQIDGKGHGKGKGKDD